MHLTIGDIAQAVHSAVFAPDHRLIHKVSTDTRQLRPGDLFVAIQGPHFDGHDYVEQALASGAAAAIVQQAWWEAHRELTLGLPLIVVRNTRLALGDLAAYWRQRFKIPLVVIVGSNGKTTVKEMIASMCTVQWGRQAVHATFANFNNDIGVPMTLLGLREHHRVAVLELGMNHPGETAILARLCQPTVAVINNAQREHQEFMESVQSVALEHADLLHALTQEGTAVLNADDAFFPQWQAVAGHRRVIDFGLSASPAPQVCARILASTHEGQTLDVSTPLGALRVQLAALGEHSARNALAAIGAGIALGVKADALRQGLGDFRPVHGRLELKKGFGGRVVVDDTYNANPDSVRAAIDVLSGLSMPRMLVLGDMGEAGKAGAQFHAEIGAYAKERGVSYLWACGELSMSAVCAFGEGARHYQDVGALQTDLIPFLLKQPSTILVKGSRFMKMERIVDVITPSLSGHPTSGDS
jgi:UDP-N-acetylmuramoyl-tripeptide--D-alanyl-D-alanine ligase